MKKILICLLSLVFLFGCSNQSEHTQFEDIQDKLKDLGYIINDTSEFDGMLVFEIASKDSVFMFTFINDQLEFTSYHQQSVNSYITYLNTKETYLGDIYEDSNNYCSYSFADDSASSQCSDEKINNIILLKNKMEDDLKTINLSIKELSDWACWYISNQD